MAGINKTKTTPFRLLTYFLYGKYEWLRHVSPGVIQIETGPASRTLRVKNALLWEYLFWLEKMGLVKKVSKEQKRGLVTIHLVKPRAYTEGGN